MKDLLVIVPSRGRPHNAALFQQAAAKTHTTCDIWFGVDDDDPTLREYPFIYCEVGPHSSMNGTLNAMATKYADDYFAIGFAGDDHRFRTDRWQDAVLASLRSMGTGICYGNDLIHGQALPTAVFITADIIRTLGYMAPPVLKHLCMDDSWLALGQALDAIEYLPDVVIEHMHPLVGKAPSDAGYQRVNAAEIAEHDRAEFERWRAEDLPAAVVKIRAARG